MKKKTWIALPLLTAATPILAWLAFLAYYSSGEFGHWPSPYSTLYWVQYILIAVLSFAAIILNIIGLIKNHTLLKALHIIAIIVSVIILFVAVNWIVSPTPY